MKYCAIILIVVSLAQANLIVNGGFEQGTPNPDRTRYNGVTKVGVGAGDIDSWEVYSGEVDYFFNYYRELGTEGRWIDLHTTNDNIGGIRQSISTIIGQAYTLEFDVSGIDYESDALGGQTKYMSIQAGNDNNYIAYTSSVPAQWSGWESKKIQFTALSTVTWISFYGNNITEDQGNTGMWIDNISVTPEPATIFLLGLGAVMLRRKRSISFP
jgi:hypothetical protein